MAFPISERAGFQVHREAIDRAMSSPLALELFPNLAEPAPARRSAVSNNPIRARAKQTTAEGRRLADIYRGILRAIGGVPTGQQQAIAIEAAELTLAAEDQRARLLKGEDITIKLMQTSKQRDRALRKLGLDGPPADANAGTQTIRDRLLRDQQQRGAV
jgi:hypothetical protein